MKNITFLIFISLSIFLQAQNKFYIGGDMSSVNEMKDCGAKYFEDGNEVDPMVLFKKNGANIVRVRLWNNPQWTNYSNFQDVAKTIKRAKEQGMRVLLDFHYSDTWADPQKQIIPKAWSKITKLEVLSDSLFNFTYATLYRLNELGLMPDFVQPGNEVNIEIMQPEHNQVYDTINWNRNSKLLNSAIAAIRKVSVKTGTDIKIIMHIAQPENALFWFKEAIKYNVTDFDIIGISYYSKWSEYSIKDLSKAIEKLKTKYAKEVMVVETAYIWTTKDYDDAANVLNEDALVENYPATPEGQYNYLIDLTQAVKDGGGIGVIYWEPAWITSPCKTLWGRGSHWENATFFDAENNNEPLLAIKFLSIKK